MMDEICSCPNYRGYIANSIPVCVRGLFNYLRRVRRMQQAGSAVTRRQCQLLLLLLLMRMMMRQSCDWTEVVLRCRCDYFVNCSLSSTVRLASGTTSAAPTLQLVNRKQSLNCQGKLGGWTSPTIITTPPTHCQTRKQSEPAHLLQGNVVR